MRGCMHLQLDQKLDAGACWSVLTCPTHPPNLYTPLKHTHTHPPVFHSWVSLSFPSQREEQKRSKILPKQSSVNQNEGWFKSDWVDCDDWQGLRANQAGSRVRGCGGSGRGGRGGCGGQFWLQAGWYSVSPEEIWVRRLLEPHSLRVIWPERI